MLFVHISVAHKQGALMHATNRVCYDIKIIIKKYSSTSYVGMGWVQNGVLYLRYRRDFAIKKAERCKAFIHKYSLLF